MITNPALLAYGTMLGQTAVNPLSPPGLLQAGGMGAAPQVPTGEVKTEYGPTVEYKTPSSATRDAMAGVASAAENEIEAKRQQKEAAVKQEQMEGGSLAAQANIAEAKQKELDALQRRRNEWMARRESERAAELDDFKKNSTSKTLFDDMTPVRQMLSALSVGAGQWAATMSGTGRNTAYEIFKDREDDWRRMKEAELKGRLEKMAASGKNAKEMIDFFDKENDLIEKKYAARQDYALKALKSLKATVPQVSAKFDEEIAKAEKDNELNKRNFVTNFDQTTREQGTSTQTSSGDKFAKGDRPTPSTDVQNFSTMQDNGRLAARLLELQKAGHVPTAEMRREYSQNEHLLLNRAIAEAHGGKPSQVWSSILRGAGVIPENTYPEKATPEQREYLDIATVLGHYRVFKMGGQTALASPEPRMAIMGPGQGGAGEGKEAERKDAVMANEFVEAAKRAEEVSRVGEKEQRVEARNVGSSVHAKKIPISQQDAAVSAVDDYSAVKAAMQAGKLKQTPNIMEAMGRLVRAHQGGTNDAQAAEYLRMVREREGI